MNVINLEKSIKNFEDNVNSLKGKLNLLEEQFDESNKKLISFKETQIINSKAIELINFVQKITRDLVKDTFEEVVSKALQFIHQDNNYKFELEFDRRGSIPELNFNIKTPDMQETHNILTTRGGGTADIVSLALRFVLLEVSKMPGFIFFDEPAKHLDSPETLIKMIEFIKEMQNETKRQVFWITHKEEVVNSVQSPIIIKNQISINNQNKIKESLNKNEESLNKEESFKKKRGRPKKYA